MRTFERFVALGTATTLALSASPVAFAESATDQTTSSSLVALFSPARNTRAIRATAKQVRETHRDSRETCSLQGHARGSEAFQACIRGESAEALDALKEEAPRVYRSARRTVRSARSARNIAREKCKHDGHPIGTEEFRACIAGEREAVNQKLGNKARVTSRAVRIKNTFRDRNSRTNLRYRDHNGSMGQVFSDDRGRIGADRSRGNRFMDRNMYKGKYMPGEGEPVEEFMTPDAANLRNRSYVRSARRYVRGQVQRDTRRALRPVRSATDPRAGVEAEPIDGDDTDDSAEDTTTEE